MHYKASFLFSFLIVFSLVFAPLGQGSVLAQDELPPAPPSRQTPQPAQPRSSAPDPEHKTGVPVAQPEPGDAYEQSQPDVEGLFTLGQPGLSFRYVETFGVTEEAYQADTAHLNRPIGLYMDNSNNLYVAEDYGNRVLKYNPAGSNLLALGTAGLCLIEDYKFCSPKDVALDPGGNLWVADGNRVVQYSPSGDFLQQLPPEEPWLAGDDNTHFNYVNGIAFDGLGRMYVSDTYNHRVQVYTFSAGAPVYHSTIGVTGQPGGDNSHFASPYRLTTDTSNQVYVVDQENNRVQRCTRGATWVCTTFSSGLNYPNGITIDAGNNVYIADTYEGRILKCLPNGTCSDFVSGTYGFYDLEVDSAGNVYGAATWEGIVAKYNSSGAWQGIFLGEEFVPYLTDENHYYKPRVAIDGQDNIIILEELGQRLVKLDAGGNFLWSVGVPGVDMPDNDHLTYPHGVAVDQNGNIYVADNDRVQIFSSAGTYVNTIGGEVGSGNYQFGWAAGIAVDSSGLIYVADCPNNRVQVYSNHYIYVATIGQTGVAGSDNSHLDCPLGIDVDAARNVYVTDAGNNRIQKFNSSRVWQMTVGTPGPWGSGSSEYSHFGSGPDDVAVDAQGRIYVADIWNNRVQVFNGTGGYLTTIGGEWGINTGEFRSVSGVDVDSQGNVYVSDFDNHRIKKYSPGVPGWQQSNLNGFGTQALNIISTLGTFKNTLYAGATHWDGAGAQLWASTNGTGWSQAMNGGFGNPANYGIDHLIEFNGNLYAGTWSDDVNGGEVWRSSNGINWAQVVNDGFGNLKNVEVFRFEVFNNMLYASTWNEAQGGEVWRSGNGNLGAWGKVVNGGFGDPGNTVVSFEVFGSNLYAGTYNTTTGGQIWRTDTGNTGDWLKVNTSGFGTPENFSISALAAFDGYLYAATGYVQGGSTQIWRCQLCDNTDWQNVTGSWSADSRRMPALETKSGMLYAVMGNNVDGLEVWQTRNGSSWEQVGFNGFEGSNNNGVYWDNALTLFNNELYVGTTHRGGGGQIWRTVPVSISGNIGVSGATLSYNEGVVKTTTSLTNGDYSFAVPYNWDGTVTPSHACFSFGPANRTYGNVVANQTGQNYTPTLIPGCADIDVLVGGVSQARFGLPSQGSTRASFSGLSNGPVKLASTNAVPLIAAERVVYKVNGVNTSFTEMMGLPDSQLDAIYWLPWYNNVELDTQLRFANVSGSTATVRIYIDGDEMTGSPFTLLTGESTRKSFAGVSAGPVKIESNVPIVAAERVVYKVNGVNTSFTEMMALSNSQLDTIYYLPWYNNVELDTQLRFANVSNSMATVRIYIGGDEMSGSPFTLGVGESTRKSFAGINDGPVKIESDVPIVAAERVVYKAAGVNTSFIEMMGLPAKQLDTTYWLPWYNNVELDTQLRFANVSDTLATVHVYIGGAEMANSPFTLEPGASTRQSFAGVNSGPVQIVSDVPIVAAERVVYKVNGVGTSFSEMMGLPDGSLDPVYWLPWYNNVELDTQLRFGRP
jgi:hypothetical protein